MLSTKARDPFFDNARYILVLFVVFGHSISPLRETSELVFNINNFLSSFRMPALILITGYFAKSYYKEGHIKKVTTKLLIPFLILQIFYSLYYTAIGGTINWFSPRMGLWFLLSLYYFNLLLFLFNKLKHPIVIAFILGLGIGCIDYAGSFLSISRTFVFFPFFLIGFYLEKEHLEFLKKSVFKVASIFTVLVIVYLLSFFTLEEERGFLLGKYSYAKLGFSYMEGIITRSVLYVVMTLGVLTFLAWVPKGQTMFTNLGQKTAYIYLLHFLLMGLVHSFPWFNEFAIWQLPLILLTAVLITIVLSSHPVIHVTKPIIEGSIYYYFKNVFVRFTTHIKQKLVLN